MIVLAVVLLGLIGTAPTVQTATAAPRLCELVERAWASHPYAQAAVERARAAAHRVDATGYWPDPTFVVAANNVPLQSGIDTSPMTGLQFRLQQTIPWPGKLRQRSALGAAQARVAAVAPKAARLDLSRQVGIAYFRIHLLDVTATVYRANERILSTLVEAADAKYRVGRGQQRDVLQAQLSRDELRQKLLDTERRRAQASAVLAHLVGKPSSWVVSPLVDVPIATLKPSLSEDALLALAEAKSPELAAARHRVDERNVAGELADIESWPDLQLGVAYTVRGDAGGRDPAGGSDFVSAVIGFQIPVNAKRRLPALRSMAEAEEAGARWDEQEVRLNIKEKVVGILSQLPLLHRQMVLLRDQIIPTARQTLEVQRAAYQVDREDLFNLLQTELTLIGRLIEFHALHVKQEVLLVELARAVGAPRGDLVERGAHGDMHEVHP